MPDRTPQQLGASNRRRGARAVLPWLRHLRANGYPHAEGTGYLKHCGDIQGCGDITYEVTLEPWSDISAKLAQAKRDADALELDRCVVVKPRLGTTDPARWYWLEEAGPALAAFKRLEYLEGRVADLEADGRWNAALVRGKS